MKGTPLEVIMMEPSNWTPVGNGVDDVIQRITPPAAGSQAVEKIPVLDPESAPTGLLLMSKIATCHDSVCNVT